MGITPIVKGKSIGLLVLHHNEVGYYSGEKASLAFGFAYQAALAIENVRLYEQAQKAAALRERQRLALELQTALGNA